MNNNIPRDDPFDPRSYPHNGRHRENARMRDLHSGKTNQETVTLDLTHRTTFATIQDTWGYLWTDKPTLGNLPLLLRIGRRIGKPS